MRLLRVVGVAVLLLLGAGPAASANPGGGDRGGFVPVHQLGGASGGELIGQWWARVLAIPAAQNPIETPDAAAVCMRLGRAGQVLAEVSGLPQTTCTMRVGMTLLIPVDLAECSTAEPDPFHGVTEAQQRTCAVGWLSQDGVRSINLSLDGGPAIDIHQPAFVEVSPQTHTVFPSDPIFGAEPGPATFVGTAYAATTRHKLHQGRHTIDASVVLAEGDPVTFSIIVNVVR